METPMSRWVRLTIHKEAGEYPIFLGRSKGPVTRGYIESHFDLEDNQFASHLH